MTARRIGTQAVFALSLALAVQVAGGAQKRSAVPANPDDLTIVHALNRLGFGPTPDGIDRVRRIGLAAYIDGQLDPERLPDDALAGRLARFETLGIDPSTLAREYFGAAETPRQRLVIQEISQQKILRAAYSERQLQEVLVDFWYNHFNVFAGKGPVRVYLSSFERDAIRPHALGRFRDLLGATAGHPAMLFYLDNWQSAASGAQVGRGGMRRPRGLNENYARELMELHTLGVDGGYTQKDVQEVARAFTGWTIVTPRQGGAFRFAPGMHDGGEKLVLGQRILAGGQRDGEQVLDLLAAHPSTARFLATKLARRFVSDAPPPAVVERAAATFRATRGDIREVVRTIVTSPEFFAATARRAKVKTPFEFVVSAVRATGSDVVNAMPLVQAARELGMPLYMCQPPTGYADTADAWVNAGALLGRMNVAVGLASRAARGARMEDGEAFVQRILGGEVSESTRRTAGKAASPPQQLALLLGSPEFQKR